MKKALISVFVSCVVLLACLPVLGRAEFVDRPEARLLRYWLQSRNVLHSSECDDSPNSPMDSVIRFYEYRNYQLAWVDRFGLLPAGGIAVQAVGAAAMEGLEPHDYQVPGLFRREAGRISYIGTGWASSIEQIVRDDIAITGMVLRFAFDLKNGRIDPAVLQEVRSGGPEQTADIALQLAQMMDSGRVAEFFQSLSPRQLSYQDLKQSLVRYESIRAAGGWKPVDDGPALKVGDHGPRVAALRDRLITSGDLAALDFQDPWLFDVLMDAAVQRFQQRHGLIVDGAVGTKTLAALNIPVEQRILTLKLNMERLRWMSETFEKRYIVVNIPAFTLDLVEDGHVVESMRVIVGRQRRRTPVLSGTMTYLEINPYWNVPQKIARKDILPKIQEDPFYLVRQGIHVFDDWREDGVPLNPLDIDWTQFSERYLPYRLRQEPNAHNALGRIKFMFPNELSIYIHDTPSKALFAKQTRSYSSGCVRIEEPLTLAETLLKSQDWSREQLEAVIKTNQRKVVVLKTPVPVHLIYLTAWVDGDGMLNFREDIYERDQRLAAALSDRSADEQACSYTLQGESYVLISDIPPGSIKRKNLERHVSPKVSAIAM